VPVRHQSVLEIRNINEQTLDCAIEVRESNASGNTIPYVGQCNDACTLTVQPPSGDWDFVARLGCSGLKPNNSLTSPDHSLYAVPAADEDPIFIAVGNCN
jgi:hypothetical protein